jgi:hypothetical protein
MLGRTHAAFVFHPFNDSCMESCSTKEINQVPFVFFFFEKKGNGSRNFEQCIIGWVIQGEFREMSKFHETIS